jgi:YfiH family protein
VTPARPAASSWPEEPATDVEGIPVLRATGLEHAFPGLVAGITVRPGPAFQAEGVGDYGLSGGSDAWALSERFERLARGLGFRSVAVGRQVHGAEVLNVETAPETGTWVAGPGDGLVRPPPGCLVVVTVADCVPVYLVEIETGSVALLHAGWRGVAAGILRRGVESLTAGSPGQLASLRLHLGPAICGECYEVGAEVGTVFGLEADGPSHVDLRQVLLSQAAELGIPPDCVTASRRCTRCDAETFHSYRAAGDGAGRMAAFLGRTS